MRALIVHVYLALLTALPLAAQSGADVMLSERDPGYRTHPAMRIQVADSANGATLVAWGSSVYDTSGSVVLTVYVQQVRGGAVTGRPLRLGRDDFQLSHEFCVVPLGGDFLVVYKAYPYGRLAGTMCQFYDATQDTLGPPYFLTSFGIPLGEDGVARTPPYAMRSGIDGWMLFWRAESWMTMEFFVAELDRAGRPVNQTQHAGPYEMTPLTYRELDDVVLFNSPFDDRYTVYERPRVYRPSRGAFDPRTLPFLHNSFHIGADTSVVVYHDTTITLYPSLFDTSNSTTRALDLRRLGISQGLAGNQPSSRSIVTRDTAGRIILYVPVGRNGGNPFFTPTSCRLVRIRLDRIDAPEVVDTVFTIVDTTSGSNGHSISNILRIAGCDNRWRLRLMIGLPNGIPGPDYYAMVDPDGSVRRSTAPEQVRCLDRKGVEVRRIESDATSIVEIDSGSRRVHLEAPVAWRAPRPHFDPAVVLVDSVVCVAWHVVDSVDLDVTARWFAHRDSVGKRTAFNVPSPERSLPWGAEDISATERVSTRSMRSSGGMMLEHQQHYYASFIYYPNSRNPTHGRAFNSVVALSRPGPVGWRSVDTVRIGTPMYSTYEAVFARAAAYDPDNETLFAWFWHQSFFSEGARDVRLKGYPRSGEPWELVVGRAGVIDRRLVPLSGRSFLAIDGSQALRFADAAVVDSFSLPTVTGSDVRFTALIGPRFVMSFSDRDSLHVLMLDSAGATLARARVTVPATERRDSSIDYVVAESPKDSSIALVVAGLHGLHATRFSRSLDVRYSDSLLSDTTVVTANPSAVFHADTLYAVWEDERDGVKRIYGNRLPRYVVDPSEEPDTIETIDDPRRPGQLVFVTIAPNPASDIIVMTVGAVDGTTLGIDLVDVLGREIASMPSIVLTGSLATFRLDLSAVVSGVYFVRVRTNTESTSRALVVRRTE